MLSIKNNNNFLIFIPLLLIGSNALSNSNSSSSSNVKKNSLDTPIIDIIGNIANTLTIDDINTSVGTLEKIGPYLPEPYVDKVNSFVYNFEKVNKVNELITFLTSTAPKSADVNTQSTSSKERFNKILLTLKDDMPEEKIKNIRPIIDIVANFDKYKGMIGMISAMSSPSDKSEDKMEGMMNMIMPMLGQNEESAGKMKDMMQVFKVLVNNNSNEGTEPSSSSEPENDYNYDYEEV